MKTQGHNKPAIEPTQSPNLEQSNSTEIEGNGKVLPESFEGEIQNELRRFIKEQTAASDKLAAIRLKFDLERLALERSKASIEGKFLNKNFGALITAVISVAAVIVSAGQVWSANIQKDRELQVTHMNKRQELAILAVHQDRSWRLDMAKFVSEQRDTLFGPDPKKKELVRSIILTTFPPNISESFFSKLEAVATSDEDRAAVSRIRKEVIPQIRKNQNDAQSSIQLAIDALDQYKHSEGDAALRLALESVSGSLRSPSPAASPTPTATVRPSPPQ